MPNSLLRLDNTLWGYTPQVATIQGDELSQIQIQTPHFDTPASAYAIASATLNSLTQQKITTHAQLKNPFFVTIESTNPQVQGNWEVSQVMHNSCCDKLMQAWPFTKMYPDHSIVRIVASKASNVSETVTTFIADETPIAYLHKTIECPTLSMSERLDAKSFDDPFTQLATLYLQTVDPNFVSEQKVLASFRFVLQDDVLSLEPLSVGKGSIEENQQTIQAFRDYILTEFGKKRLDYVNSAYGFSLDEMLKTGQPLTPDHVFKVNIGMNNVELADVQALFEKLLAIGKKFPESTKEYLTLENFQNGSCLSLHEFRALLQHVKKRDNEPNYKQAVLRFIQTLPKENVSVQSLDPQVFNTLVSFTMPDSEARARAYTGRKISLIAIHGSNTMGNPDIFNPSRDLFELLQVFDQMQKQEDWTNYFELLTHVAAKKTLPRETAPEMQKPGDKHWHVGILLPAPLSSENEARWYYNEACFDDGQGNINYVLLPACDGYRTDGKALPFIKNYRSTASDSNAFDSRQSIAADLNPYGSPGSIDPKDSFAMEKGDFFKRTIPLWVAKLLHAEKKDSLDLHYEALDLYIHCLRCPGNTPGDILLEAYRLKHCESTASEIGVFLRRQAQLHQELPEYKIAQDIACIGHSLGGALAQFGTYFFGPRLQRIPLEGHNTICYASRGPAIDTVQDTGFMQFGKTHTKMLQALNVGYTIIQDFSSGDFIPQSGHSHLGTTGYSESDSTWLTNSVSVFQPLKTAKALEITTAVAHARRTGTCQEGLDFKRTQITQADLHEYDHAWLLSNRIREIFDYVCCISSKAVESGREILALLFRPYFIVAEKVHRLFNPAQIKRNSYGGFSLRYR